MRRSRISRRSRYDGIVLRKCLITELALYLTATGHADYTINWCGAATTGDNNYVVITDTNEFTAFGASFREYRVVGVKWEAHPIQQINTSFDSNVTNIATVHQHNVLPTGAMADNQFYGQDTFKLYPWRKCSGYINVRRWNRGRGFPWYAVGTAGPDAGTLIRFLCNGFGNLQQIARVTTTYYV